MNILTCMRNFIEVVNNHGLSSTARLLRTTPANLSKQMTFLENWVGKKLLYRTTREFHITEEGKVFYETATEILGKIAAMQAEISDLSGQSQGHLRLSMPTSVAQNFILVALFVFLQKNANMSMDITNTNHLAPILAGQVDIAFSSSSIEDANLIKVNIGSVPKGVYATPAYFTRYGIPETPGDLQQHNCLFHSGRYNANIWEFNNNLKIKIQGNFSSNDSRFLLHAALSDIGLIWVPQAYAAEALQANLLTEVLQNFRGPGVACYLYYLKHLRKLKIINEIIQLIETALKNY